VLAVLCWSGFSERVHPLEWVEPGVAVVADVDVPPVVVDDAVMVSTKEYQVASKSLRSPLRKHDSQVDRGTGSRCVRGALVATWCRSRSERQGDLAKVRRVGNLSGTPR